MSPRVLLNLLPMHTVRTHPMKTIAHKLIMSNKKTIHRSIWNTGYQYYADEHAHILNWSCPFLQQQKKKQKTWILILHNNHKKPEIIQKLFVVENAFRLWYKSDELLQKHTLFLSKVNNLVKFTPRMHLFFFCMRSWFYRISFLHALFVFRSNLPLFIRVLCQPKTM